MASLFVIQGRDQGRRFELGEATVGLGRDPKNTVQLHDSEVSRRHAQIVHRPEGFFLADLGSSNGTIVNGGPIREQPLRSGDRIQLGRTLMIFTGNEDKSSLDLAAEVDIFDGGRQAASSRIVTTVGQEQGGSPPAEGDFMSSPWLARTRSNLQIMYQTALAVSHTLDIDQLLQSLMEFIFEWVEADRGCIMLLDRETYEFIPKVFRHRQGIRDSQRMRISQTILDYVMEHQEGVLTSDARQDERWDTGASILKQGVREAICVPMQGRYDIVGAIYIDTFTPPGQILVNRQVNKFSEEHLKLMIAIAHQAALAVEDTSYYSALVQAERLAAVGQTIATLSHHIKNILQGIRGGSYLIEEGLRHDKTDLIRRGWGIVDKNQEKISNLVMDMLTFSKERQPEKVPADLNAVVSDVIELMSARAADASVRLEWLPAPGLPQLSFDPEALHRAILNVVTNAIDACEGVPEGRVQVTTEYLAEPQLARVLVGDNGEGISPEDVRKIFTVFESSKGSRGTGLGLPVSLKILQEHGGDIHVESTPNQGSTFRLEFPAPAVNASADGDTGSRPVPPVEPGADPLETTQM